MTLEYLDRPAPGFFALPVMPAKSRSWSWVALMIDVDPEGLRNCTCDFPARFWVDPDDYRPGRRMVRQHYLRIPGCTETKRAHGGLLKT
jgi:hypothetical protein